MAGANLFDALVGRLGDDDRRDLISILSQGFSPEARAGRGRAAANVGRNLEQYIPPNLRPLASFLVESNPVMGIDRAGDASARVFAPNRTGMERIGDLGAALSETAGVVAPMGAAAKVGRPAAEAMQEGLLGMSVPARSAAQAVIDRANQPGPVPTMYSNPIMRAPAKSIDDQISELDVKVAALRQTVLDNPDDTAAFNEYKSIQRMRNDLKDQRAVSRAEGRAEGRNLSQAVGADVVDTSYRMEHQPVGPQDENPIRLDDLTKSITGEMAGYPEDFYGPQGMRFYAQPPSFPGDEYGMANQQSYRAIQAVRGNPDAEVTIYRGVPDEDSITSINPGDFVSLSPKYAEIHASSGYGPRGEDAGKVISQKVKVRDVYFAGDDVNEFGYFPDQGANSKKGLRD